MKLTTNYMTRNDCYTAGKKIKPIGIMVHSTAAPGVMAAEWFARWNKSFAKGETDRQVCVHAFVDDKEVCQYLPWDHRGWHCGGSGNNTHIGFEICEPSGFKYVNGAMSGYDVAKNEPYFRAAWKNAVELCVLLCKKFGLNETNILCHSEGYRKGIASNHGDVMHWFPKHGENMETFRAAVKNALAVEAPSAPTPNPAPATLYRVRRNWSDAKSQKGAFQELDNAKRCADQNPGYSVFNEKDVAVYSGRNEPANETYTVRKGDTLWDIAAAELGNGKRYPEIARLNNLQSDMLSIGQVLKIPKK